MIKDKLAINVQIREIMAFFYIKQLWNFFETNSIMVEACAGVV